MKISSLCAAASVALAIAAPPASADDACATFFWTGAYRAAVERYQPHYLIGEGLADVGMGHIVGQRIRIKWSQQAAACFASTNPYGYFYHSDFDHADCFAGETCFPGTRWKKLSERLADVRSVVQQLSIPHADPVYQASRAQAKASSFVFIAAMENAKTTTASFYQQLANQHGAFIDDLTLVLDLALPPGLRTSIMDEVCSPANVAQMDDMMDACYEGDYCELTDLYGLIQGCDTYANGTVLDQMLANLAAVRASLVAKKSSLLAEQALINSLWADLQALQ